MRYLAPMLALLLLGAAVDPRPLSAQPYRAREGVQSGQVRPLDQILNGVRRQRPGNLADVEGPNFGPQGDAHYRLKWVSPDGRVQWLDTDARTGRVLGVEGEGRGGPPVGGSPFGRPQAGPRGYDPRGVFSQRPQDFEPGPGYDPTDNGAPPNFQRGFRRPPPGGFNGPNGPDGPDANDNGRFGNVPGRFDPNSGFDRGPGPNRGGFDRGGGDRAPRGFGRYGR